MIVYVLRYWPALTETFVAREIAELARRGHAVGVVSLGTRADSALADPVDVPVWELPRGATLARAIPGWLATGAPPWLVAAQGRKAGVRASWLARLMRDVGAVRVHAHFAGEAAELALAAAELAGVPFSVTVHAVDLFVPRPAIQRVLDAARPAITISTHHQRWLDHHHHVDAVVVPCGVDPAFLEVGRTPPNDRLRVISVARNVPKKGLDLLVAACDGPNLALRLVSDATPLRPSEIPAALAAADVFALPCREAPDGDRDGIPVALLEAMAAGLPVITTSVAGIPEIVDESVGWLVPPDDVPAIRAALDAARDPAERARRGDAGRRRIREAGRTIAGQVDAVLAAWDWREPEIRLP